MAWKKENLGASALGFFNFRTIEIGQRRELYIDLVFISAA
jgi:hypothetical protein